MTLPEARSLTGADLDAMVARELDDEVSKCPCGCGTEILSKIVVGKSGQSYRVGLGAGSCGVDGFCIRPAYSNERIIDGRIGALALKHLIEFDEDLFRAVADTPVSTSNIEQGVGLRGQWPDPWAGIAGRQRGEIISYGPLTVGIRWGDVATQGEDVVTQAVPVTQPQPPDDPPQR